ncbi:hypothetical protein HDU93_002981 [Gonapodya sp. JEL0774]|nr:hypothetical protein HDU93_002981 [Gonapodya sp. JEL0774]
MEPPAFSDSKEITLGATRRKRRIDDSEDAGDIVESSISAGHLINELKRPHIQWGASKPLRKRRSPESEMEELDQRGSNAKRKGNGLIFPQNSAGPSDRFRVSEELIHLPFDRKTLEATIQRTIDRSHRDVNVSNVLEFCGHSLESNVPMTPTEEEEPCHNTSDLGTSANRVDTGSVQSAPRVDILESIGSGASGASKLKAPGLTASDVCSLSPPDGEQISSGDPELTGLSRLAKLHPVPAPVLADRLLSLLSHHVQVWHSLPRSLFSQSAWVVLQILRP